MRVASGGDRRRKADSLAAVLVAVGLIFAVAAPARAQASPSLAVSSSCANPGSSVTVSGSGFQPGVVVSLVAFGIPYSPSTSGSFSVSVSVPVSTSPGTYAISANHAAGSAGVTVAVPCNTPEPTTTSEPVPTTTGPPTTRPPTTGPPTTRPVPTTVPTTVPTAVVAPTMSLRPASAPAGATVVVVGTGLGQPCDVALDADVDLDSALVVTGDECQPGADGGLQVSFAVPALAPGVYDVVLTARDLAGTPVQLVAPLTVTDCELPSESVILGMDPIAGEPGTRVLVTLAWRDVPEPCLGLAVELRFLGLALGGGAAGGPGQVFEAVVPATVDEELSDLELVRVDDGTVVGRQAFEVIGGMPPAEDSSPWLGLILLVGGMVVVFGAAVAIGAARTPRVPDPAPVLGLGEPGLAGGTASGGTASGEPAEKARVRARRASPVESDPWDWKAVAAAVVVGVVGLVVLVRVISSSPERAGEVAVGRELGPVPASIVSVTSSSSQADEVVADIVFTYGPANTLDGDPTTAWSHGTPGKGEGERLVYTFAEPVDLVLVEVVNGFNLNQEVFFRNGRVAELEITTDSGSEIVTLDDRPDPQQVEGAFAGTTTRVELAVVSVYPGSEFNNRPPFDDVSLSEVVFFGR